MKNIKLIFVIEEDDNFTTDDATALLNDCANILDKNCCEPNDEGYGGNDEGYGRGKMIYEKAKYKLSRKKK